MSNWREHPCPNSFPPPFAVLCSFSPPRLCYMVIQCVLTNRDNMLDGSWHLSNCADRVTHTESGSNDLVTVVLLLLSSPVRVLCPIPDVDWRPPANV